MFKILLINQVYYDEYDAQLEVKEVSISELLENPDYEIQAALEAAGWKNVKKVMDREKQLVLNKSFYMLDNGRVLLVDVDKLQSYNLTSLAYGSTLVQEVNLKSVLSEKQYKDYQRAKKTIEDQKKKQAEVCQKRAEKKKAKELAKAAKLLEENGIEVNLVKED